MKSLAFAAAVAALFIGTSVPSHAQTSDGTIELSVPEQSSSPEYIHWWMSIASENAAIGVHTASVEREKAIGLCRIWRRVETAQNNMTMINVAYWYTVSPILGLTKSAELEGAIAKGHQIASACNAAEQAKTDTVVLF